MKGEQIMNKSELVEAMAKKTAGTKKATEESLNALTEVITEELAKGEKIQLVGFGSKTNLPNNKNKVKMYFLFKFRYFFKIKI